MSCRTVSLTCLVIACVALSGCDSLYRALGKEKVVPDEFAVVSRAPLAVPPDFSLRPPRVGEQRPQEQSPDVQARDAVFRVGDGAKNNLPPAAGQRSPGEGELLKEAGASETPTNIRQLVEGDADTGEMSTSFVDKLAFWRQDQKLGPTDNVIDPVAESERLKAASNEKAASDQKQAGPSALATAPTIERTGASSSSNGSSWFGWFTNLF